MVSRPNSLSLPFRTPATQAIARRACEAREKKRIFSVSPQSRSPFSASFHTFSVTARVYLNTQKYGLFCSLVMSKLDYGCVVFSPLPEYQMKWPQRVQTTCAGYLLGRYAVLEDLQRLNWLPIIKRRDLALPKITHKSLYDDVWPDYLRLKFHTVSAYNPRSSNNMRGLPTWAVCRFRGLAEIKLASSYKKERPSTTENHS